ncbi:MAG: two-component system response regulator [Rhodospirillaceae bacterium]
MSTISVVVVDDDPFIREVLSTALGATAGVHVQCFASAAEALAAVRIVAPDIIVLDYTMPDTDGLAVLGGLRAALPRLPPVIFLTAREDAGVVAKLRAEGAAVLAKPFDPRTIAAEILHHGEGTRPRDARLDAVAASFRASLPQTMAEIDREWSVIRREWQRPVAESLLMRVHKLAGAAGLFKLDEFGHAARVVEGAVQAQLDAAVRGQDTDVGAIEPAVATLWDEAIKATG